MGLIGKEVGNWILLELLGEGGFAAVYKASHKYLQGRIAAIKLLKSSIFGQDEQAFINEAQLLAQLHHPHIIEIKDFGFWNKTPYLVMTYAERGSLRKLYMEGSQLTLQQVLDIIQPIGEALQYAHDNGRVHRDVKPDNVLIDANGILLLSDFGAAIKAQSQASVRMQDVIIGTVEYMAPEQANGFAIRESDQYALAAMVYELLAGQPPFVGNTQTVLVGHLTKPVPKFPSLLRIPGSIEKVVLQGMAKEPKDRHPSVKEFVKAFAQATTTPAVLTPAAPITPPIQPITPPARPNMPAQPATNTQAKPGSVLYTYTGHKSAITAIRWSPVDDRVVSAENNGNVHVWRFEKGQERVLIGKAEKPVRALTWNPIGMRIIAAQDDTPLSLQAMTLGNPQQMRAHTTPVTCAVWANKTTQLPLVATGDEQGIVNIWHPQSLVVQQTLKHTARITDLCWSPDNTMLAVASEDMYVHVYETNTWKKLWSYTDFERKINESVALRMKQWAMYAASWSPTGQMLFVGGNNRSIVVLRNTGELSGKIASNDQIRKIHWSPNNKLFAVGTVAGIVTIHDQAGEMMMTIRHSNQSISSMTWSSAGNKIALASEKDIQISVYKIV